MRQFGGCYSIPTQYQRPEVEKIKMISCGAKAEARLFPISAQLMFLILILGVGTVCTQHQVLVLITITF